AHQVRELLARARLVGIALVAVASGIGVEIVADGSKLRQHHPLDLLHTGRGSADYPRAALDDTRGADFLTVAMILGLAVWNRSDIKARISSSSSTASGGNGAVPAPELTKRICSTCSPASAESARIASSELTR